VQEKEACVAGEHGSIYGDKAHSPLFLRQGTKAPLSHVQQVFFFFFFFYDLVPFFILSSFLSHITNSLLSFSQEQVTLCILLVMGQIWLEERTAAEKLNQNANGGGNGCG
jgi:hypothetical protein